LQPHKKAFQYWVGDNTERLIYAPAEAGATTSIPGNLSSERK